jgi:arylsulfatase A-like enzyme
VLRVPDRSWSLPALIGFLAALWGCGPDVPSIPCPDCNVLLISVDTLRADHLNPYGYERPTSPYLDALATEAVVFEQVFNHGTFTLPEHVSMLTSVPPAVHGISTIQSVLEPERVTMAEQLRAAGHRTAAFTDGAWMASKFGLAQGFESYDDEGGGLRKTLPKTLAWIETHRRERWFLFLHTYDVHTRWHGQPYKCPGGWGKRFRPRESARATICTGDRCGVGALLSLVRRRRHDPTFPIHEHVTPEQLEVLRADYDGCIRWVDERLRELVDRLKAWGLYERTLIVVTSDHGEKFLEHGQLLHDGEPFDELVRVPLIMRLPGAWHAGRRVAALSSAIDLMPTVLGVVGVTPNGDVQGRDLLPLLGEGLAPLPLVSVGGGVRSLQWKLIRGGPRGADRLYDLEADPGETRDVARRHAHEARALRRADELIRRRDERARAAFAGRSSDVLSRRPPRPSADEVRRLRALGYLD